MNKVLLVLTFVCCLTVWGQENAGTDTHIFINPNSRVISSYNTNLVGVTGKPFINDFFLANVEGYRDIYFVRYDAHKDKMHFKNPDDKVVIVDKSAAKKVMFKNGQTYEVFDYNLKGEQINGYLKVISSNDKFSLLKKETIKFIPAKAAESSYQSDRKAAYKRVDDIYLVHDKTTNSINDIGKKKAFLSLFPDKKSELEKFLKSNKIKLSKEQDLIKLVNFLNANAS